MGRNELKSFPNNEFFISKITDIICSLWWIMTVLLTVMRSMWGGICGLIFMFTFFCRFGVYVPLCCFHQDSRAHLLLTDYNYVVQHQAVEESASTVGGLAKSKDFLSLLLESLKEQFNNATPIPTHSCPLSPDLIRNEVECLKADFNHRIKEVLFNSLFSAYYVAFLPLCFVKVSGSLLIRAPRFVCEWHKLGISYLIPLFSVSPLAAWMVEFGCIWSALIPLLVGG